MDWLCMKIKSGSQSKATATATAVSRRELVPPKATRAVSGTGFSREALDLL
jgi:hypothetical protein